MSRIAPLILLLGMVLGCHAQVTVSSCASNDSIKALYRDDAINLALDRVYSVPVGGYRDSIGIPQTYIDTFLNALIAVYNDTTEPKSDTVCRLLSIHAHCPQELKIYHTILVAGDSSLIWMHNLKGGIIPTGYGLLDSFLVPYRFTSVLWSANYQSETDVVLETDSTYNMEALIPEKGSQIPGVHITPYSSQAGCAQLHADHILDSLGTGFIDLTYQHGYNNCQIGCLFFKNWKFRVYANCGVEYLGDTLYDYSHLGIAEHDAESLSLYPNPATDKLTLSTSIKNITVGIFDMTGRECIAPYSERSIDISSLSPGLYWLRAQDKAKVIFKKFVKE